MMNLNFEFGAIKSKSPQKNLKKVNLKSVGAIGAFSSLHKQTQINKVSEIGGIFQRA